VARSWILVPKHVAMLGASPNHRIADLDTPFVGI
jgi:hypothetical protein